VTYNTNMKYNRDDDGKFANKKRNWTKILLIGFILFIVVGGLFEFFDERSSEPKQIVQTVEKPTNNELDRIMNEENFHKATILRARKVASDNKRAEATRQYNAVMAEIEAENEAIRAEELNLVGTGASLK